MTNLKNIVGGSLLGLAILIGGGAALAQQTTVPNQDGQTTGRPDGGSFGRGKRGGFGGERAFAALNLTDAQKTQIEQIRQRHRESTQSLREQLRAAHDSERAATEGHTFNESAVRAAAQAAGNARVELAVAEARMRFEIFNVLTAEQKAQLEQLKAQRRQQFEQRREQFRQRRQAAQPSV